ncbi:hypothetical protein DSAG12_01636 [Promethearchaeum syntrophicum]|uniref:Tetratricopeptide repeat protein n=1 Tax=Promethearchaeum syntrophicum TaxID=2594042 RepID=A0A5B9D9E8_9ARCH|nr:hypothetical protein [Candidatus Prometheoarchaeum syntrophicum]QEE15809.1 hypothetical protein DSAG12_01636 [Candidatus Prometheoarchaeum syntrophicum]
MSLDKKADELESKIKKLKKSKDYEQMIPIFMELKDIYKKLNFTFLANKAETEMYKYQKHIEQSKLSQNFLGDKKSELNQRKKQEIVKKIQETTAKLPTPPSNFQDNQTNKNFNQDIKKSRAEKIRDLKRKKEIEQQNVDKANAILDKAQSHMKKKDFELAAKFYNESSDIFKEIGWNQQASMLKKEALHMQELQEEYLKKMEIIKLKKQKEQEMYDTRASKIMAEKEEKIRLEQEALNKLPPEIQRKIDLAKIFLQKTELMESKGKIEKSLVRYKYLLELYEDIPDTNDQKGMVLEKIKELEKK